MAFSSGDGDGPMAEINIIPLADVMLVLLIIFMVTTPLMNLGTDINLPDSRAMSLGSPQDPVVVSVYPDGALALMVEQQNTSVTREDLVARLRGIHTQNPDATILVLQGIAFVMILASDTLYGRFRIFQPRG